MPLIRFTSSRRIMGEFISPRWLRNMACVAAVLIVLLNGWLVLQALAPGETGLGSFALGLLAVICSALLAWVSIAPLRYPPESSPNTHIRET